jgi:RecB family exonuclease
LPLLITGPPGSTTTEAALRRFQARDGSVLLVPTSTMADHLRHTLVRAGFPVRPLRIQTIAAFLDTWSPLAAASAPLVQLCMERALDRVRPARFVPVAEFPGVVRELAGLFGEVSGARMPDDVGRLFADVERQLSARGMAPRHARLAAAAARIAHGEEPLPPHIVFDGFFKLSAGESALVAALERRTELTITLPEWSGADRAREGLGAFDAMRVDPPVSGARTSLVTSATMEREVEEIARRILDEAARGRAFRDIGIVLRARDPYGPLVETTLARFGIPARAYFIDPLASHPAVQFRMQMVRSALAGWDHEPLLSALRMPASGLGATRDGDVRDFEMRRTLPGRGWGGLLTGDPVAALKRTREWLPELAVEDHADPDRVRAWRSTAAAHAGFDDAIDAAALAFEPEDRVALPELWRQVERILAQEPLRVPDARRNVVHVLDAYEARQWSLPLVFVPGLTERHFPQYHREDAIVGDAALRRAGLDTKADREREERFLFDLAASRATEETVLSYPRFDENGQSSLPSFFLNHGTPAESTARVRPAPAMSIPAPTPAPVPTEQAMLSASSIETYLQCPFQFFTRKTLRLKERPKAPRDRLNFLVQGSILHHALAEWTRLPLLGASILEQAFDEACAKEHVPRTYRTEAVRLELLRHFEAFIRDQQVDLGWTPRVEESFEFALNGSVSLRGRVDRMDVSPSGEALVIDYKYSALGKLKERIEDSAAGNAVQAGVYLLAAERAFGFKPAGMLFCHMKKGVKWDGWHADIGLNVGERRTAEGVRELALEAEQTVLRVHEEISSGRVAVQPKDDSKCNWCEARDVCRVESMAQVKAVGA